MNNITVSLKDFFGLQDIKLDEAQLKTITEGQAGQAVQSALANLPGFGWRAVAEGLASAIAGNFNFSLGGVLAGAWSKGRELQKYLDKPEATNYLRLAKHTVVSDHEPEVEVLLNDNSVAKVKFAVKFKLEIDGASLMIHDGMIKKVTAVSGKGSCTVSYKGYDLFKKESQTIDLPGEVEFKPGIVLRPSDSSARITQTFVPA